MPTPEEIAAKLKRRNQSINTSAKGPAKKRAKRGTAKGRKAADPVGTMKRRTRAALQSRAAKRGGVKNLTAADRALAQREDLNLDDLF